jgi:hypothetical protein
MSDDFGKLKGEDDFDRLPSEGGAMGGGGSDNPKMPSKRLEQPKAKFGDWRDALKTWADTAAGGAGPQIEGLMASGINSVVNPVRPASSDLEVYRGVRDMGKAEHDESAKTVMGGMAMVPGMLSTPIPVKGLKGASVPQKLKQGAMVGGPVGLLSAAAQSPVDLTRENPMETYARFLLEAGAGGIGGAALGGAGGAALGALEKPLRSTARKMPMDILGVSEPARRSMQRQGTYDAAGDELLKFVKPFRSGMRKGSLTEDLIEESGRRGQKLGGAIDDLDKAAPGGIVTSDELAASIGSRADPMRKGSVQDKQVVRRMKKEADNIMGNHGELLPDVGAPMSLADAEKLKQRFGPAVAKQLRHAGEPAAKTDALSEVYRAIKQANEAGAQRASPELAAKFKNAKRDHSLISGPLEGASVERSGMMPSDFDWGDALTTPTPQLPGGVGSSLEKALPIIGPAVVGGANLAGRAYGRGLTANMAELLANRAASSTGGAVGGQTSADALAPWARMLMDEERQP